MAHGQAQVSAFADWGWSTKMAMSIVSTMRLTQSSRRKPTASSNHNGIRWASSLEARREEPKGCVVEKSGMNDGDSDEDDEQPPILKVW
jgi:hypothetical protein